MPHTHNVTHLIQQFSVFFYDYKILAFSFVNMINRWYKARPIPILVHIID